MAEKSGEIGIIDFFKKLEKIKKTHFLRILTFFLPSIFRPFSSLQLYLSYIFFYQGLLLQNFKPKIRVQHVFKS